jgi:hypothetical protein
MTLPLPGGPRRPQLRSPESFQAIYSSHELSRKASFSSEERSTTGNPYEASSCSYVGDGDPCDETSGEEAGGGEDPIGEGNDIEGELDEEEEDEFT